MSARLKLFIPLVLFVVLAGFLYRGLSLDPRALPSTLVGKPFPLFSLPSLMNGKGLDRGIVLGQVSLVNVWATWCPTCRQEHAYLGQLAEDGVRIIGINYKDDPAAAREWLARLGDPYIDTILDVEGGLGLDLGIYGAPETFVVDAEGVVRYRHVGVVDAKVWREVLGPLYRELDTHRGGAAQSPAQTEEAR